MHIRSLTKDHALPEVRIAAAVGTPGVIEALDRARPPWPVSAGALAAAEAIGAGLGEAHLARTLPRLREERKRIEVALARLGIRTVQTDTHFLITEVGNAPGLADRLKRLHGIRVRDCTSFGYPEHIRLAARTPAENQRVLDAFTQIPDTNP